MTAIWPVITGRQKSENLKKPLDSITDYFTVHFWVIIGRIPWDENWAEPIWPKKTVPKTDDLKYERCKKWSISNVDNLGNYYMDSLKNGRSKNEWFQKWAVFEVDGLKNEWFQNGRSLMRMIAKVDGPEIDIFDKNESVWNAWAWVKSLNVVGLKVDGLQWTGLKWTALSFISSVKTDRSETF